MESSVERARDCATGVSFRSAASAVALLCAASLGAAACDDVYGIRVPTRTSAVAEFEAAVEVATNVDVLFVIDNSGSMAEEQDNLKTNFSKFIEVVGGAVNDYHIGVITTDMNTCEGSIKCECARDVEELRWGGKLQKAPNGARFLVPPKDVVRAPGVDTPSFAPADNAQLRDWFGQMVTVGVDGCGFEQGLEAARRALTPPLTDDENEGFLRDDALLVIIIVADEDDCSHPAGALNLSRLDECETFKDRLFKANDYARAFRGDADPAKGVRKPRAGMVALATIIGAQFDGLDNNGLPNNPKAGDCETDPDTGLPIPPASGSECDPRGGGACGGYRYGQVRDCFSGDVPSNVASCPVEKAGQSRMDSICRRDWSQTMLSLGKFVAELSGFTLTKRPDCRNDDCRGEIILRIVRENGDVDEPPQCCDTASCGARVTDDCWEYVPPTAGGFPQIKFRGTAAPAPGEKVNVKFRVDVSGSGSSGGGSSGGSGPSGATGGSGGRDGGSTNRDAGSSRDAGSTRDGGASGQDGGARDGGN